jgi:hypothetical protein
MHLQGIAGRNKTDLDFLHVAQLLNNGPFRAKHAAATSEQFNPISVKTETHVGR